MRSYKNKSTTAVSTLSFATFFLLCFALFSFILTQGCGGKDTDTDTVPSVDTGFADTGDEDGNLADTTKPDPDTSGEDADSEMDAGQDTGPDVGEKYRQACNLCQQRNGSCKGPSAMPDSADSMKMSKLAEQICNCSNPESFGEKNPEPCDDPCANEREVQYYGWDCPHVTNDNNKTYQVEVKDGQCMMKNQFWGPWPEAGWRYDGGSKLERYDSANSEWVTCTGSCYKPNKCSEP